MHDVLGHLVVAAGDPHLAPEEPVAAVVLPLGARGDVGEVGAGVRLREHHRAEPAPVGHGHGVALDLVGAAVRAQQVRRRHGQQRVGARARVGCLEPGHACREDARRKRARVEAVDRGREESGVGERAQRDTDLGDDGDARAVVGGLGEVGEAVVRRELRGRDLLGEVQHGVDGVARVVGVVRPGEQLLGAEPLVQEEVEVAPGHDRAHGALLGRDASVAMADTTMGHR